MCCSVLQQFAVCCSVLIIDSPSPTRHFAIFQNGGTCKCFREVCCSSVCCSVCCTVLQHVHTNITTNSTFRRFPKWRDSRAVQEMATEIRVRMFRYFPVCLCMYTHEHGHTPTPTPTCMHMHTCTYVRNDNCYY